MSVPAEKPCSSVNLRSCEQCRSKLVAGSSSHSRTQTERVAEPGDIIHMLDDMFWRRDWHGVMEVEVEPEGSGVGRNGVRSTREMRMATGKRKDDSFMPADEKPDMHVQAHHGCNCRIEC